MFKLLVILFVFFFFYCKSTYKKNKTAAKSFMKTIVNFETYMSPTYNQQQFNLVYKQQQNALLMITMGSIKYQI